MFHQKINTVRGRHYSGMIFQEYSWDHHFHNSFELIYLMEGHLDVLVNHAQVRLEKQEFLLIAPGMIHAIRKAENNRFFISIFTADYVMEFYRNDLKAAFYKFTVSPTLLAYLTENMINQKEPNPYIRKSCLYAVCAVAREMLGRNGDERGDGGFVMAVNQYIANHFTQNIRRQDIAAALNYEEHYFSRLFHKIFDIGLKKYLNIYRFALAQRLLRMTKQPIGQIALECGFSSVRAFNDTFKQLAGMTPREYRKQE